MATPPIFAQFGVAENVLHGLVPSPLQLLLLVRQFDPFRFHLSSEDLVTNGELVHRDQSIRMVGALHDQTFLAYSMPIRTPVKTVSVSLPCRVGRRSKGQKGFSLV